MSSLFLLLVIIGLLGAWRKERVLVSYQVDVKSKNSVPFEKMTFPQVRIMSGNQDIHRAWWWPLNGSPISNSVKSPQSFPFKNQTCCEAHIVFQALGMMHYCVDCDQHVFPVSISFWEACLAAVLSHGEESCWRACTAPWLFYLLLVFPLTYLFNCLGSTFSFPCIMIETVHIVIIYLPSCHHLKTCTVYNHFL